MNQHQAQAFIEFANYVERMEFEWWDQNRDLPPMNPGASELDPVELIYRWSVLRSLQEPRKVPTR